MRRSTNPIGSNVRLAVGALALAFLGGCLDDPTEVIIVADTDLTSAEFGGIEFGLPISFDPVHSFATSWSTQLPATMGYIPQSGGPTRFDVIVQAKRSLGGEPVVTKRVSNIPFISGEMRVVFVPLLRSCACQGTNCPSAPECLNVVDPVLTSFDEDHLPRLR